MRFKKRHFKWLLGVLVLGTVGFFAAPSGSTGVSFQSRSALSVFRSFSANLMWVRAYVWWDRQEENETIEALWRVVKLDPAPLHFWLNGARMMAYDMPVWPVDDRPNDKRLIRLRRAKFAREAIRFLEAARRQHPDCAALWIEQGNIELNALNDIDAAALSYRTAAESGDAPHYAARIHGELLKKAGKKREAYFWLRQLHPRLAPHDPEAAADLVLRRIRELESDLSVPHLERYHDTGG